MKAQLDIEFILSASLFIAILVFVSFFIANSFPSLHREMTYNIYRSRGYQASQILVAGKGVWTGSSLGSMSQAGLTDGEPYLLNLTKINALNNCNDNDYSRLKSLLGVGTDFEINIIRINFIGGSNTLISQCKKSTVSYTSPRFLVSRVVAVDGSPRFIARLDIVLY